MNLHNISTTDILLDWYKAQYPAYEWGIVRTYQQKDRGQIYLRYRNNAHSVWHNMANKPSDLQRAMNWDHGGRLHPFGMP